MEIAEAIDGIYMRLVKRGDTYHLRKRVPVRYAFIESREYIWITLKTDSERDASRKAAQVWDNTIAGWEAQLAGNSTIALARFDAARNLAHARGFNFLPVARVAELPINDLLNRVEASVGRGGRIDSLKAATFLGGEARPAIKVSEALDVYFGLAGELLAGKSQDQIRRWENPRKKAFADFIKVVGDPAIQAIDADAMLTFRNWLANKVVKNEITANSANKAIIHFCGVLRHINRRKQLGIAFPFADLAFREKAGQRVAFDDAWIREKIIGNPKLMALNVEARVIMLGMVNTGYRPSEVINLGAEQIRLDGEYPHLRIEPVGRTLKNDQSKRIIPLVGVSLEAFKLCPSGFPRYFGKASFSAVINKFMRENGMMPTEDHVLYSLRHAFEDRMLAAGVDERIRCDLMGHQIKRQRYGAGATLAHLHKVLQSIAL